MLQLYVYTRFWYRLELKTLLEAKEIYGPILCLIYTLHYWYFFWVHPNHDHRIIYRGSLSRKDLFNCLPSVLHIAVLPSSSGVAEVKVTVPDTITEWKAGALCLSNDTGLGLSLPASLQAFQPFFVELTMPYSVIRGEAFTLKATVLNYLPKCIRVRTSLS